MTPAELHNSWRIVAIQVVFFTSLHIFYNRQWSNLWFLKEDEPPDQQLSGPLRCDEDTKPWETSLRVQLKLAWQTARDGEGESPLPQHDDAFRCLLPDSGWCPLLIPPPPPRMPHSWASNIQTGSSSAQRHTFNLVDVAKGGAARMGLGYPSLKVSLVDRPYLPWPPA